MSTRRPGFAGRLAALALAVAATAACDIAIGDHRAQVADDWTRTYELGADGRIEIDNVNGRIEIEGTDSDQVDVRAERIARAGSEEAARELLANITIAEDVSDQIVRIETKLPPTSGLFSGHAEVRYRLRVPAATRVKAHTVNGEVDAVGVEASLDAETTNGRISGRALSGPIKARTVNGEIEIDVMRVVEGGIRLNTVNGGVVLRLTPEAKASLLVSTTNGGISTSGLSIEEIERSRRRLEARLNGGGERIEIGTTNGGVTISAHQNRESRNPEAPNPERPRSRNPER